MDRKLIFKPEELKKFSEALEGEFEKVGLSDVLTQSGAPNNHLDEGFFKKLNDGFHLVECNALKGI